jgi:hypothetical protein
MRNRSTTFGVSLFLSILCLFNVYSPVQAAEVQFYGKDGRKGCRFTLEIAKTPGEQARGLMFRDFLAPDRGMLFIFDGDEKRNF